MIELVYPYNDAPDKPDMCPVVNENGEVLARSTVKDCQKNGLLYPVIHFHILNRNERMLLVNRASCWGFAASGTVLYGESLAESLMRIALKELSLTEFNPVYIGNYVDEKRKSRKLVNIFAAIGDFSPKMTADGILQTGWYHPDSLPAPLAEDYADEIRSALPRLLALL